MTYEDIIDAGQIVRDHIQKLENDIKELNDRLIERQQAFMKKLVEVETENRRLKKLVKDLIPPCTSGP